MSTFTAYTSNLAQQLEVIVLQHVSKGLYGEELISPTLDWDEVKSYLPNRIDKIKSKSKSTLYQGSEGWDQIGIDIFFQWEGISFAVDITTGSSTVVKNKKKKIEKVS